MNNEQKVEHELFDVSILLKGAHALVEILGGIFAYFISSDFILRFVVKITQGELLEDPNDFFTKHLLDFANSFSLGTKQFVAFYLFSHGIINFVLVLGLFRKKMWAYHSSFFIFTIFVIYQIYRYTYHPSIFMILLTLLDLITIWLVYREYMRLKAKLS